MSFSVKQMRLGDFVKALARPTGLALAFTTLACALAIVFLVPLADLTLAAVLGVGLWVILMILAVHTLAVTRWTGNLDRNLMLHALELGPIAGSIARLDSYTHAADVNVGRIAMLQAMLEARILELELGFDRAGVRFSELECRTDRAGVRLSELECRTDRAGVRLSELECRTESPEPGLPEVGTQLAELSVRISELEHRIKVEAQAGARTSINDPARIFELELGFARAGVRISELERRVKGLGLTKGETQEGAGLSPDVMRSSGKNSVRRKLPEKQKTFFLHIPKCAGTTVWYVLGSMHGWDKRLVYQVEQQPDETFAAMDSAQRRKYLAIGGHGTLSYFKKFLGDLKEYHKIIILRDPIDRILSEYNYVRALRELGKSDVSDVDFDTFAAYAPANIQVFALTDSPKDVDGAIGIMRNFFNDWAIFPDIDGLLKRTVSILGSTPQNWAPLNETTYHVTRADVSKETIELLKSRNAADLELLDFLRELDPVVRISPERSRTGARGAGAVSQAGD